MTRTLSLLGASALAIGTAAYFGATRPTVELHAAAAADPTQAGKSDHTMFGGTNERNMVNLVDKGLTLPTEFHIDDAEWVKKWVLWRGELGSRAYGGPIIAGGKVFVGTNNDRPRNERDIIKPKKAGDEPEPMDKGNLYCFDEKTGKFLWQAVHDKLPSGQVNDWPREGICSTPLVEGNRVYYVSNRCTVVCADVDGRANGAQGKALQFIDSVTKKPKPAYDSPTDVDVIWEYDMMKELNVFPHNMSACSPLLAGDIMFIVTANGVDEGHINIPSPEAPSYIALDKKTGKLLWKNSAPGTKIMHGQWSNAVYADINGVKQVIFPGGDGWLRAYVPETGEELWKFDCNPKDAIYELGGTGTRNDFIGTPVVHDGLVYIGVGQDPEHTTGIAHFWCISPTKKGDISPTLPDGEKDGKVQSKPNPNSCVKWHYGGEETRKWAQREFKFGRTMSSACIVDDICYIAELAGYLHCINAKTGEHYWQFDTKGSIWGSAYFVDGKILLATDSGDLFTFKHDKNPKKIDEVEAAKDAKDMREARKLRMEKQKEVEEAYLVSKMEFDAPIRSTAVVSNGVLYVMTEKTLYALKAK